MEEHESTLKFGKNKMIIELNDQEQEDLKQVIYAKIKELDADPESKIENSRKGNLANRLDTFYERLNNEQ